MWSTPIFAQRNNQDSHYSPLYPFVYMRFGWEFVVEFGKEFGKELGWKLEFAVEFAKQFGWGC